MLKHLSINNVVLIDKAEITFSPGLCVLTGETGSGKSILLDALGLAIGFRSNFRLIGSEQNKASIFAEFDVSQNYFCKEILKENDLIDIENPNILRIRRSIHENSSSKAFVNDISIGVTLLGKIGETLVEIHGQHDQRGLLNPSAHLGILDEFSRNEHILKEIKKTYFELKETNDKISELKAKKDKAEREKDYLEHVVRELEEANLEENEEEKLISQKDQLVGKEKILNFLTDLKSNLTEANSQLILGQKILIRNQHIIDNFLSDNAQDFEKINEKIDQQSIELDESISNCDETIRDIANSENNLDEIEERLFFIRGLARKHNVQVDELPNVIKEAQEKLQLIAGEEEVTHNLEEKSSALFSQYQKIAKELSNKRQEAAKILSAKVEEELGSLKMAGTKFLVEVTDLTTNNQQLTTAIGNDRVRFRASINNNSFDDISKIASGGELSRFMLALKVALMEIKSVPTIIFDEIDTGIGGNTADAVGKRLKILSQNLQTLVVTHQPQIASKASLHFKISKISNDEKINTIIETLDQNLQEQEIARMISGEIITDEAISAAKTLINNS